MSGAPSRTDTSGGGGLLVLLTVLFVGLKLGKVIDWSWWWVLAPLWAPWAILFGILAIIGIVALLVWWFER